MHTPETPSIPADFNASLYQARRQRLAASMVPGSIAIVPTAPERLRNRDCDFPYRHDSYFYYLSGFTEPGACLVLSASGHSLLLCQPRDPEREIWDGYRLGPQAAPGVLAVDEADSIGNQDARITQMLQNSTAVYYPFATHTGLAGRVETWLATLRARARYGISVPQAQYDLCSLLDEMRLLKDGHELALIRKACGISASAHIAAMQCSARMLAAGADTREYHLEAELLHVFRSHGAQFPAYTSIVAAGANACVLHYRAGDARLRANEVVLIDAGCELDSYASDISRSFPAGGRFSGPQRDLYDLVLASEEAAIGQVRASARFTDPHDAAVRVLTQGMLDLKLLDADKVGSLDDAIAARAYFQFYMHRTGHWMGLDVHDCGSYNEPGERGTPETRKDPLSGETIYNQPSRILRPGMVLTVEPGIYIRPAAGVPEHFHHIGIRIEDDAIVTEGAPELPTRGVPVKASEIEALMRQ